MSSSSPLVTIRFFRSKDMSKRWHLLRRNQNVCRSMWTSVKLLEILIENEKKWTSNYFWSGERISQSPTENVISTNSIFKTIIDIILKHIFKIFFCFLQNLIMKIFLSLNAMIIKIDIKNKILKIIGWFHNICLIGWIHMMYWWCKECLALIT
jgi:hypothetical protein